MSSSFNYMDICRLCLVKEQVSIPIFDGEGDTRQIFVKISTCLPVKISREDRLPKTICNNCVYRVETSYHFWNSTLNAEKQLLEWVNKNIENEENANKEPASDSNGLFQTEQLMLKEEYEYENKSTDQVKVNRTEEDSEDDTDSAGDAGGDDGNSIESGEDNTENIKTKIESEDDEAEEVEESGGTGQSAVLEPTTFVNVSLACDEPGPSGLQPPTTSAAEGLSFRYRRLSKHVSSSSKKIRSVGRTGKKRSLQSRNSENVSREKLIPTKHKRNKIKTNSPVDLECDNADIRHSNKTEKCKTCGKRFETIQKLNIHLLAHTATRCPICHKEFPRGSRIVRHIARHDENDRPHKCLDCNKRFKTNYEMTHHQKAYHSGQKNYFCKYCDYATYHLSLMVQHEVGHTRLFKHKCNKCKTQYRFITQLQAHNIRYHNEQPFVCDVCKKTYSMKRRLDEHKKTHLPGYELKRKHQCETCGKAFVTRKALTAHLRWHSGEKPFVCAECGKGLTCRTTLLDHMKTHTGEKPHVCEVCGKAFSQASYMKIHARSHSGERPYKCPLCNKSFTQKTTLRIHNRYHTGERPYKCTYCDKCFITKTVMKSHEKTHVAPISNT